ncbi:efflux RND transporter periplasmic adaptor subunit [Clostridium aminobutyricum]|uniref:Efflux RND transporter periplasmic adaptor subunit n=1 Tax=Clostridium aminobutyricum TaxID=33953 RepID=A0A939IHM6_CLOAM|nr:efflux RND transporter periplasmic adaptor subunit [Clostridium aminobutyricum]MBN7773982.1 efflux RND transporter periplasmic adaptor subunit [Clostridium aminobutyricum]
MKRPKKMTWVIIAGVVAIGFLVAISLNIGKTNPTLANQTVYADQESSGPAFIMAGRVEAIDSADISTKTTGKIAELNVDVGSVVNKGDVLARIDMKEVPAQVNQAQSSIDIAKVTLNNAQINYDRTMELYQAGAVAKETVESAKKQLDTAAATVNQAQSGLELINANSSNGVIVAPISGTVTAKTVNVGELAAAGSTLLSIVNSDKTYISAYLPARLSEKVQQGQKVTVKISEIPDKFFDGEVSLVDTIVDAQNKNILVRVNMLENDPAVKVGMFAEIALKK